MSTTKLNIPLSLLFLSLLWTGCRPPPKHFALDHVRIRIDANAKIPDYVTSVITNVVHQYDARYGLGFQDLTLICDTNISDDAQPLGNGQTSKTLATARPQEIRLNLLAYSEDTRQNLMNVLKHELFHTIKKGEIRPMRNPRPILDEHVAVGFDGLSMSVVHPLTKKKTAFRAIEEAAAEYCAHRLGPGYSVGAPDYFSLGVLMKEMSGVGWISAEELIHLQKTGGFLEFCAKILNKDVTLLSDEDIRTVCSAFQRVRDDSAQILVQMKKIIQRRGETDYYRFRE